MGETNRTGKNEVSFQTIVDVYKSRMAVYEAALNGRHNIVRVERYSQTDGRWIGASEYSQDPEVTLEQTIDNEREFIDNFGEAGIATTVTILDQTEIQKGMLDARNRATNAWLGGVAAGEIQLT